MLLMPINSVQTMGHRVRVEEGHGERDGKASTE